LMRFAVLDFFQFMMISKKNTTNQSAFHTYRMLDILVFAFFFSYASKAHCPHYFIH
jgi:hypothetical protein